MNVNSKLQLSKSCVNCGLSHNLKTVLCDNCRNVVAWRLNQKKKVRHSIRKSLFGPFKSDDIMTQRLENEGYTVLRSGWPDILAIKDGKVRMIEVKSANDFLRLNQDKMHRALKQYFGITVEVIKI